MVRGRARTLAIGGLVTFVHHGVKRRKIALNRRLRQELDELDVAVQVQDVATAGNVVEVRGRRADPVPHDEDAGLGLSAGTRVVDVGDDKTLDAFAKLQNAAAAARTVRSGNSNVFRGHAVNPEISRPHEIVGPLRVLNS